MSDALSVKLREWARLYTDEENCNAFRLLFIEAADEIDRLRKQCDILAEALRSVVGGPHEGMGFCYAVTGHRPCRCYVHDATEALKAAGLEVEA